MFARSCSMEYRSFFHPGIPAAKDPTPDLLGSSEEDGDLYAELWQQILQLTSDSDDNLVDLTNQSLCQVAVPSPITCSDWRVNNRNVEPPPVWWLSPPSSGSGTGVFIPSSVATERGGRQGRAAKKKKKKEAKKQVENK
ncbi:uncharacterized protein LOC115754003 [Rhodamnia argentea]|uniref:Uncharacterized protein LOC115754003 n=1 Tax=Rhodamnia argentea TaxID=178133 RepID=A0A8B8QNJ9_9MYRT|nr:uncharacterized protein LOC115754003 [Rhodamnia argentea]